MKLKFALIFFLLSVVVQAGAWSDAIVNLTNLTNNDIPIVFKGRSVGLCSGNTNFIIPAGQTVTHIPCWDGADEMAIEFQYANDPMQSIEYKGFYGEGPICCRLQHFFLHHNSWATYKVSVSPKQFHVPNGDDWGVLTSPVITVNFESN